jgi:hypothetical protein
MKSVNQKIFPSFPRRRESSGVEVTGVESHWILAVALSPNPSPASGRGERRAASLFIKLAGLTRVCARLPQSFLGAPWCSLCLGGEKDFSSLFQEVSP